MYRKGGELWRRDPRPGALVIAFGIAIAAFAALVAAVLLYRPFVALDMRVSGAIRSIDWPWLEPFFRAVTHIGDGWVIAVTTALLAVVMFAKKRPAEAVLVGFTVGAGSAIGVVVRQLVVRVRPGLELARIPIPDTYAFPSGHALTTFLLAGMVFFVVALEARNAATRFRVLAGCVLVALLVAISRVYLGVHWFGDVLAAWILGSAWMTLCAAAYFAFTSGEKPA